MWVWRNEPQARAASFNTAPIPYEDHERWFSTKLADARTRILIISDAAGKGIGYVRFDLRNDEAEISVGIDSTERGRGYGSEAIRAACEYLVAATPVRRIIAQVKLANAASKAAFERAGFAATGKRRIGSADAYELVFPGPGPRAQGGVDSDATD